MTTAAYSKLYCSPPRNEPMKYRAIHTLSDATLLAVLDSIRQKPMKFADDNDRISAYEREMRRRDRMKIKRKAVKR